MPMCNTCGKIISYNEFKINGSYCEMHKIDMDFEENDPLDRVEM